MARDSFVLEITSFFLKAMLEGYAGTGTPTPHPTLLGWKQLIYSDGPFRLIDEWDECGGRTMIYYENDLVWIMRYEGTYRKEVIPFLKTALLKAYSENNIFGCRGPAVFTNQNFPGLIYYNEYKGPFTKFRGEEHILNTKVRGTRRNSATVKFKNGYRIEGIHKYWGGILV